MTDFSVWFPDNMAVSEIEEIMRSGVATLSVNGAFVARQEICRFPISSGLGMLGIRSMPAPWPGVFIPSGTVIELETNIPGPYVVVSGIIPA